MSGKQHREVLKVLLGVLGEAVNLNCFSDEIHGLPPIEKFISPHGIVDSRIGAIRIYACGDRYLRNRPAQRQGGNSWGGRDRVWSLNQEAPKL